VQILKEFFAVDVISIHGLRFH